MTMSPNLRMALIALATLLLDRITKAAVLNYLPKGDEKIVISGFFKLVHWGNTGAAWSLFHDKNSQLAIVSLLALLGLFIWRHHFETRTLLGQISLGLIFGGILGNLYDRLFIHYVVDFIRFYIDRRGGTEIGFPAFNVADSGICVGEASSLYFRGSRRSEKKPNRNRLFQRHPDKDSIELCAPCFPQPFGF
jgi:signal peptidase II